MVPNIIHDPSDHHNDSIVKYYEHMQLGISCHKSRSSVKQSIINNISKFKVFKAESPFDRRVTFLVWHPTNPKVIAVASKGGDIILWNYETQLDLENMVKGIGAGGSIQAMKFDPLDPIRIYTVSIEGKFVILNFITKEATQFLDTGDFKKWYVSFDVDASGKTMVAGDNCGYLTLLTTSGEVVWKHKFHQNGQKITHAEFNKREPSLLCTTSNDSYIKLWDIRMVKTEKTGKAGKAGMAIPLTALKNEKPQMKRLIGKTINAAYFSLTNGCRLLATDQAENITVYRSPLWNLETEIHHPHRQFQHLTPIRAYWHPLEDIILVGRYPDPKFPGYEQGELRTIDFFDADNGALLHQHSQSSFNGIMSLNRFNHTADALASCSGRNILIWRPYYSDLGKDDKRPDDDDRNKNNNNNNKKPRKRNPPCKTKETKSKMKKC